MRNSVLSTSGVSARRRHLRDDLQTRLDTVSAAGHVAGMAGWAACASVIKETMKQLDRGMPWLADADRIRPAASAHVARFIAAYLLDASPRLSVAEAGDLRGIHAHYAMLTSGEAPVIIHGVNSQPHHADRRGDIARRAIDAPHDTPLDSVNLALERAERAYRMEADLMRGVDGELPGALTEMLVVSTLDGLADDMRSLRGATAEALQADYDEAMEIEDSVLHAIASIIQTSVNFVESERALRFVEHLLGEQSIAPSLGRSDTAMLGMLASTARLIREDYGTTDPDFLGGFAVADAIAAHFRALSLDAASLTPGQSILDTTAYLPAPDLHVITFRASAAILGGDQEMDAYAVFHMHSSIAADAVSGAADLVRSQPDRDALRCAARQIEQHAIGHMYFPRQVAAIR